MVTIYKSTNCKMEAFPMTLVYYCLETSRTHLYTLKKFYFMHFSLFFTSRIWTLFSFRLDLIFYLHYAICFWLIYCIYDYLVMGHVFYDIF